MENLVYHNCYKQGRLPLQGKSLVIYVRIALLKSQKQTHVSNDCVPKQLIRDRSESLLAKSSKNESCKLITGKGSDRGPGLKQAKEIRGKPQMVGDV